MRTVTQVGEPAGMIERDRLSLQILQKLKLVGVTLLLEISDCITPLLLLPHIRLIFRRQLVHPLLDLLQVLTRQSVIVDIDVVVKSRFDRRPDAEFRAREERFNRFGHQVSRAVPESMLAPFVIPFQNPDRRVGWNLALEIPDLTVYLYGKSLPSQSFADALRNLLAGDVPVELLLRPGREWDRDF